MKGYKHFWLIPKIKKTQIKFANKIPDLVIIAQGTMNFEEANFIAQKNGLELNFKGQKDFERFLIQVGKVRIYENKRQALR